MKDKKDKAEGCRHVIIIDYNNDDKDDNNKKYHVELGHERLPST